MMHKGIEYEIAMIEPGLWKYQFRIGAVIRTGKTKCSLERLADRRVRHTIDKQLRKLASQRPSKPTSRSGRPASGATDFSVIAEE